MERFVERTGIYHEHQQGALCGQHAINNLLQSQVFLADSLAAIAHELDKEERNVLINNFSPSENMDDTGFFNIQVLQQALKTYSIELVSYASQEDIAKQARSAPHTIQAYICNLGLHWFTIRRFGRNYFNLNSFYYVPGLISHDLLREYFKFIQGSGYSVFIVQGELPVSIADQQLSANPISLSEYKLLVKDLPKLIVDNKIIDDLNHSHEKINVPPHLYQAYQRNPNDPEIKKKLLEYAPKHITDTLISNNTDPNYDYTQVLMMTDLKNKNNKDLPMRPECNCPHHQSLSQRRLLTDRVTDFMDDDSFMDDPVESNFLATYSTQYVVAQPPKFDDSNEVKQRRIMVTRQLTIINRSPSMNNPLADDQTFQENIRPNLKHRQNRAGLLHHMLDEPFNDSPENSNRREMSYREAVLEEYHQRELEAAIAESLAMSKSTKQPTETTPESKQMNTIDASSKPLVNSDRTSTTNVSTTNSLEETPNTTVERLPSIDVETPSSTSSLPVTSTSSGEIKSENSSLTQTLNSTQVPFTIVIESSPVLNSTQMPTLKLSTKSISNSEQTSKINLETTSTFKVQRLAMENLGRIITKNSEQIKSNNQPTSAAAYSFPLTETNTLDIEEIRKRRLLNNGNRDRSIISKILPIDD